MTERNKDVVSYRMTRAEETLEDARILARAERWNACVNRLYYACFYAVSALLVRDGLSSSKHAGIRGLFMMKTLCLILAILATATVAAKAEVLKTLSLDDPSAVSLKIKADHKVRVEGKSSVKIATQWPVTVCISEVAGLDVEDAKLVYSAKVKSELEGRAFLEMWAHINGGSYFSRGINDAVSQTTEWKTIKTLFVLQKGQKPDRVTLNLTIDGKGTVWIDDIVLSKESLN